MFKRQINLILDLYCTAECYSNTLKLLKRSSYNPIQISHIKSIKENTVIQ